MFIKAWSGSFGQLFSVDEASVKEAAVRYFSLADRSVDVSSLSVAQEGVFFVHIVFFGVENTHHIGTVCVCPCLVIASVAILLSC